MRLLGHLVGIIRLLCIAGHLQNNQPLNPLSWPIFVALLKSVPFDGASRFEGVDLADVEPQQKLRDDYPLGVPLDTIALMCRGHDLSIREVTAGVLTKVDLYQCKA